MQIQAIAALEFLKQVCAIKNNRDFLETAKKIAKEKCPSFHMNFELDTFIVVDYLAGPVKRTIYQIVNRDLLISHLTVTKFLEDYLSKKHQINAFLRKHFAQDAELFIEANSGALITLIPPKLCELDCSDEYLDPSYIRNKMDQLNRAKSRLRQRCPHKNIAPGFDMNCDLMLCKDCDAIINPENPKKII